MGVILYLSLADVYPQESGLSKCALFYYFWLIGLYVGSCLFLTFPQKISTHAQMSTECSYCSTLTRLCLLLYVYLTFCSPQKGLYCLCGEFGDGADGMGMAQEKEWQLGAFEGHFPGTCASFSSLNSVPFLTKITLYGNSSGVAKNYCWVCFN